MQFKFSFFLFILGEDKILVFSTVCNIQKLSQSIFWIVDDTFKTVPTIFTQLYTIYAKVGFGDNSRVFPLIYVLMTSKREQCYNQMYQVKTKMQHFIFQINLDVYFLSLYIYNFEMNLF